MIDDLYEVDRDEAAIFYSIYRKILKCERERVFNQKKVSLSTDALCDRALTLYEELSSVRSFLSKKEKILYTWMIVYGASLPEKENKEFLLFLQNSLSVSYDFSYKNIFLKHQTSRDRKRLKEIALKRELVLVDSVYKLLEVHDVMRKSGLMQDPLFIVGETGLGKTAFLSLIAEFYKSDYQQVAVNQSLKVGDILDSFSIDRRRVFKVKEGEFKKALLSRKVVFNFDEANSNLDFYWLLSPFILREKSFRSYQLIEGEVCIRDRQIAIMCTGNPRGRNYAGRLLWPRIMQANTFWLYLDGLF